MGLLSSWQILTLKMTPVCREIYNYDVKLFDIKMWLKEITFACFFLLCKWRTSDLPQRQQQLTSTLLTHNKDIVFVAMEPKVKNFYCFFSIAVITASVLKDRMTFVFKFFNYICHTWRTFFFIIYFTWRTINTVCIDLRLCLSL